MADTKTTKTKSTAKRKATKKTAAKSTVKEPEVNNVVQETEKEIKKPEKRFDLSTLIRCRSVRHGDLIYVASNGYSYVWNGFGDLRELPYQEIISMKSRRSKFLYEPWLIIEDEDLLASKEFAGEFDEMYQIYADFENPEQFFDRKPSEIKEVLKNAPNGLKDLIVYNAGRYMAEGILDSVGAINAIDDVLGTKLKMLL